jgi:hypothetical protein
MLVFTVMILWFITTLGAFEKRRDTILWDLESWSSFYSWICKCASTFPFKTRLTHEAQCPFLSSSSSWNAQDNLVLPTWRADANSAILFTFCRRTCLLNLHTTIYWYEAAHFLFPRLRTDVLQSQGILHFWVSSSSYTQKVMSSFSRKQSWLFTSVIFSHDRALGSMLCSFLYSFFLMTSSVCLHNNGIWLHEFSFLC